MPSLISCREKLTQLIKKKIKKILPLIPQKTPSVTSITKSHDEDTIKSLT